MRTSIAFDTLQVVFTDDTRRPIVGPDAPDGSEVFTPFSFDERIHTSPDYENSEEAINVLGDPKTAGIPDSMWQCGVANDYVDLEPIKLVSVIEDGVERWTAQVRKGHYYRYKHLRYLFPDRSVIQYIDNTANVGGRNVLALTKIPQPGGHITATIWERRVSDGTMSILRRVEKKLRLTGIYDTTGMRDTVDESDNVIWDNVDIVEHEFLVKWSATEGTPPTLYFNKDYTFLVGLDTVDSDDKLEFCEYLGQGDGSSGQSFSTKYFPIIDNAERTLYEYPLTALPRDVYTIDFDRGELTFSGNTTAGTKYYLRYRPTLEVEYEPENCNTYRTLPHINLDPVRSFDERGLIYLTEQDHQVAYITLTSDATEITATVHGPLYLGADYCYLVATAYNIYDQVVPNVPVTFYMTGSKIGQLNGSPGNMTTTTDSNGQAKVLYTPPRSAEAAGQYLNHLSGEPANMLRLVYDDGFFSDIVDSVYVYKVYNDDGLQPWTATPTQTEHGKGGRKVIMYKWSASAIHPSTGNPGAYIPWRPLSIQRSFGYSCLAFSPIAMLPYVSGTLVGFWVVSTRYVPVNAKAYSTLSQQWVTNQNSLKLKLELPEYMKGSYVASGLETPYGYRLPDGNYSDVASGLDAGTFLDINI